MSIFFLLLRNCTIFVEQLYSFFVHHICSFVIFIYVTYHFLIWWKCTHHVLKKQEVIFVSLMDPAISTTISLFAHEGSLEGVFLKWVLLLTGAYWSSRKIKGFDEFAILFYECTILILGFWFLLNDFKIEDLKHMMISPLQLNPVS